LSIRFFFSGCAIGNAISRHAEKIGSVYASSLYGSSAGCAAIFFLIRPFGGVKVIFLCALMASLAAISFSTISRRWFRWGAFLAILLSGLLLYITPPPFELRISQFKALSSLLSLPDGHILATRWNTICRTDVVSSRFIRIPPAGLSLNFMGEIPRQDAITSDADSPSPITHAIAGGKIECMRASLPTLPYRLGRTGDVLIIGAGGGLDVLVALSCGATRIDAVEINPDVIDLLKNRFSVCTGRLFSLPGVRLIQAEGREHLRRSAKRYDVIQIPLFDSVAASSAGVHGFSENYLYTVESFRDCLARLTPHGVLCVTRWIKYPPRDSLRLLGMGLTALEREGVTRPGDHLALIRSWSTTALFVSPSPFTAADITTVKKFCDEFSFDPVYFPGITPADSNRYNRLSEDLYFTLASKIIDRGTRTSIYRDYFYDISPPSDDRPFFYHYFKLKALPALWRGMGREWTPFAEWGELILIAVLLQAVIASGLLILLPLTLSRRYGGGGVGPVSAGLPGAGTGRLLCYFFLIGLAFISVEITLMQKFTLALGHPSYAMAIILCCLLLFAGLGSRASERIGSRGIFIPLGAMLILYAYGLPAALDLLMALSFSSRIAATILLIFLPGFLMGTAFPLGIRIAHILAPRFIPWLWAANGAASVVGAVGVVFVALYTGFTAILAIAALIYALAALLLPRAAPRRR